MPSLTRITIYPIKSLDGHQVSRAEVLPSGALAGDRRFALQDSSGRFVNGKKFAAIHRIRARFTANLQSVSLSCGEGEETFELQAGNRLLAEWCSQAMGLSCQLVENTAGGFPDDCESPGPTLISEASLREVASWFEGVDLEEARRRFRMNLEIDAEFPFWEDRLAAGTAEKPRFRIGSTVWYGRGVCARCVVPTRDAMEGSVIAGFAKEFVRRREETLPDGSPRKRFDHFYRLGVNTSAMPQKGSKAIAVGELLEELQLGKSDCSL